MSESSKIYFGKQLVKNKPYFYQGFPLTDFFCATKYWKMRKTIFTEGFLVKQMYK